MSEIAALGLRVDGVDSVDRATSSLGNFTKASGGAEKSADALAAASKSSSRDVDVLANSSKNASSGMDSLASTAKRLGGILVAAFAGIKLGDLVKEVALANSRFEQLGTVMEVVGRNVGLSSDQVGRYAKEVQSMGISMAESRETVIRMVQAQMDLSKASELARLAQDAAVIANTNSSDALGRLIYGLQSGQVEILRTMGLNVNFANSYTALAKEMGVAVTELTEADKAQARTNAVMQAGVQIAGAYEASMDSASKQLGSTTRYVQDLGVMIGGVFSDTTKQLVFGYSDSLKELHSTVTSLSEDGSLERWSKNLASAINAAMINVKGFTAVAVELGKEAKGTADNIGILASALRSAGIELPTMEGAMRRAKEEMQDAGLWAVFLAKSGLNAITGNLRGTISAWKELQETLKDRSAERRTKALNDLLITTTKRTENYGAALGGVSDDLGGIADNGNDAEYAIKKLNDEFTRLENRLDPVRAKARSMQVDLDLLHSAWDAGIIKTREEYERLRSIVFNSGVSISSTMREEVLPAVEEMAAQADPLAESWQAALERIDSAFVDLWKSAFDGFKDFSDALKNAFLQLLAELAHRATTQKILVSLGLTAGSGGAMAGGIGGGGGGLSDLMSLSSLAGFMKNKPLEGVGAFLKEWGWTDAGMKIGNMSLMDIGLSAMAGYAGSYLGSNVAESIFGKSAESAWGATVGGIVGSFWGPIGSGIGAALGSLVDTAFGGDGKKRSALGVSTSADWSGSDTIQAASGLMLTAYAKRAGDDAVEIARGMQQIFLATDASLTQFFTDLGATVDLAGKTLDGKASQFGDAADGFFGSAAFNGALSEADLRGATDEFVRAWVDQLNASTGNAFDLAPIVALQREGELLADILIRAHAQFAPVNTMLELMGMRAYELSVSGMAATDKLVQLFGSLDTFTQSMSSYYQLYFTEEERRAHLTQQVTSVLAGLNLEMPSTISAFRETVEHYADMGEAGQTALATLIQIAPAFYEIATAVTEVAAAAEGILSAGQLATYTDIGQTALAQYNQTLADRAGLEEQLASVNEQIAGLMADMKDSASGIERSVSAVPTVIDAVTASVDQLAYSSSQLRSWAQSVQSAVQQLMLSELSPLTNQQRLQEAQNQFARAQVLAEQGDASQVTSAAQAYLREAASYFASSDQYSKIFAEVSGYLSAMGNTLETEAQKAERIERQQRLAQEAQRQVTEQLRDAQRDADAAAREAAKVAQQQQQLQTLLAEQQRLELALANSYAIDAEAVLNRQLDALVDANSGIQSVVHLLSLLPQDLAAALGGAVGISPAQYGGTIDLAERMFQQILGRAGSAAEIAYWRTIQATGTDGADLVNKFVQQMTAAGNTPLMGAQQFMSGIPTFASGGAYQGGLALVGERGPELINFNSPGYVHNASDTSAMISGGAIVPVLEKILARVEALEARADQRLRQADQQHREDRLDAREQASETRRINSRLARAGEVEVLGAR